jgi:hypothetical protein
MMTPKGSNETASKHSTLAIQETRRSTIQYRHIRHQRISQWHTPHWRRIFHAQTSGASSVGKRPLEYL